MTNFDLENKHDGIVVGLDEVGRGPLAGSVVAACVYIPPEIREMPWISEVKDSKKLSHKKLEMLYTEIINHCPHGIAAIPPSEIDEINILQASLKAMRLSLENSGIKPVHILVDGNRLPLHLPAPATPVIKGDSLSKTIAAASIIAKVTRDREMHTLAQEHPHYGWESNVGYPSPAHLDAINDHGITPHHRKSFAPVKRFLSTGNSRV